MENQENKKVEEALDTEPREEAVEVELEAEVIEEAPAIEVAEESGDTEEKPKSDSKKRIDRLTKLRREAERREQDALRYAEGAKKELEEMRARMRNLDQGYVQEFSGRVDAELGQVKKELQQAMSVGDSEAAVEAQEKLAKLSLAAQQARQAQIQQERRQQQPAEQGQQQAAPQPPLQQSG